MSPGVHLTSNHDYRHDGAHPVSRPSHLVRPDRPAAADAWVYQPPTLTDEAVHTRQPRDGEPRAECKSVRESPAACCGRTAVADRKDLPGSIDESH